MKRKEDGHDIKGDREKREGDGEREGKTDSGETERLKEIKDERVRERAGSDTSREAQCTKFKT